MNSAKSCFINTYIFLIKNGLSYIKINIINHYLYGYEVRITAKNDCYHVKYQIFFLFLFHKIFGFLVIISEIYIQAFFICVLSCINIFIKIG